MTAIKAYALPLLAALIVHGLVGFFVVQGFSVADDVAQVITPKVVNARLMAVEPKAKQQPRPAVTKPRADAQRRLEQQQQADRQAAKKAKELAQQQAAAAAQEQQKQRQRAEAQRQQDLEAQQRRERLAALGDLAEDSLQRSLEAEAEQMQEDLNAPQVSSYQAGIYQLVRDNWSRPPSARNGMQARFLVELIPNGELLSVALVEGSGSSAFDRSAEQAIRQARRFEVPDDNALFEANFRRFYFLFRPEDLLR